MKTQILLSLLFLSFVTFSFAQDETETNNQKTLSNLRRVPFQFTLFTPPIGTNGIYFLNTINDVSLNTFIGVGGARLMCAWDTREETVHAFVADLKTELRMAR